MCCWLVLQSMVRADSSQLVMFDINEIDNANSASIICCTNITGLLSPDLLYVYVSNVHRMLCSNKHRLVYFDKTLYVPKTN